MALSSNNGNDSIELEPLTKQQNDGYEGGSGASGSVAGSCSTPKPKRTAITKKLQFSTPEFSVTPISTTAAVTSRLLPSRRRFVYFMIIIFINM